jgi:hypothetical protein
VVTLLTKWYDFETSPQRSYAMPLHLNSTTSAEDLQTVYHHWCIKVSSPNYLYFETYPPKNLKYARTTSVENLDNIASYVNQ